MKNQIKNEIFKDINAKINRLESLCFQIDYFSEENKIKRNEDFIGLEGIRKYYLKKCYTFETL